MPMFDPNAPLPSFDAQTEAASRQRKMAELLRKKSDSSQTPQGNMVSGIYVAPSITQYLAQIFDKYQAGAADRKASMAEDNLNVILGADANKWRSSLPQAKPAVPGITDEQRAESILNDQPHGPLAQPAQPLDRQAVLKYTLAGMRNPKTRDEAVLVNKVLNDGISRTEEQGFRGEQARIAAQERLDLKREQFEAQDRQLAQRLEDKTLDRQSRDELQRARLEMQNQWKQADLAARRDIANLVASTKAAFAPKPPKPLPAAQSKAWIENNTALRQIDRAMEAIKGHPNAFGLQRGLPNALGATVGGMINQRLDPKGIEARAIVGDIGSLKIHDRSGAAVTAAEFPRLVPFIPLVSDDAKTIEKKLKNFNNTYNDIQQEIIDYAETQNYMVPSRRAGDKPKGGIESRADETRVIGGKTYIKRGGDWFEQ